MDRSTSSCMTNTGEFLLLFQDCDFILGRCSLMLQYNIQILNAYYHFLEENPTLCILDDDEEMKDILNRLEIFEKSDEESIKNEYIEHFIDGYRTADGCITKNEC